MKLSNTFKSTVAVLFTAAGLVSIASVPSSAAAKVSCYELSKTTDVLTTKTATKCPSGYTKGTPSATLLQGTNNTGDIDLYHGTGVGTLAINGSSFDTSLVTATTSGSGDFNGVAFSSYAHSGSGGGRSGIEAGTLNIGSRTSPSRLLPVPLLRPVRLRTPLLKFSRTSSRFLTSSVAQLLRTTLVTDSTT